MEAAALGIEKDTKMIIFEIIITLMTILTCGSVMYKYLNNKLSGKDTVILCSVMVAAGLIGIIFLNILP